MKLIRLAIYLPMVVGGLIGLLMGKLGWQAIAGMTAGAAVWLAYEMRLNSKLTEAQMKQMQEQFDVMMRQEMDH